MDARWGVVPIWIRSQDGTKAAWPEDEEGIAQNLTYFFTGHSLKMNKIFCAVLGDEGSINYLSFSRRNDIVPIKVFDADIFSSTCQTLVNTVNCVGVMGAGLALEFKQRYPAMFKEYRSLCKNGGMKIGTLWIYRAKDRWVLNFPTKQHWRGKSKEEYLHAGLKTFMDIYLSEGIESIAFPLLGAGLGGLNPERSQEIMMSYLRNCSIPVVLFRGIPSNARTAN